MSDISIHISDSSTEDERSTSLPHSRPISPTKRMDQASLRKVIMAIQGDASIDIGEKARRVQDLMMAGNTTLRRTNSMTSLKSSSTNVSFPPAPKDNSQGGCMHYERSCRLLSDCCQKWYDCRFCHNEAESHEIDRFATQYMLCMHCKKPQKASQTCAHCGTCMGEYYCGKCKLWDHDTSKANYHCDGCGLCRRGPQSDYIHCDTCQSCMSVSRHGKHKCIERSLDCNCPICGENLFHSTRAVCFLERCGHPIHSECYTQHISAGNYQCPVCFKSVCDTSTLFTQIDMMLATEEMPPEYANLRSYIFCNDCEKRTWTSFHFIYHKCQECSSYNTKLLKTHEGDNNVISSEETSDISAIPSLVEEDEPESNDEQNAQEQQ